MNSDNWQPIENAVLCYVKYGYAYFTTQPLEKQWGDDWDDAPYEHNAGDPYTPYKDGEQWEIHKLAYEAPMETPAERANGNSAYSVEMVNGGAVAWLSTDSWCKTQVSIRAGVTMPEFIELVQRSGGTVYAPLPDPPKEQQS
jgi:hypothetical protein